MNSHVFRVKSDHPHILPQDKHNSLEQFEMAKRNADHFFASSSNGFSEWPFGIVFNQ